MPTLAPMLRALRCNSKRSLTGRLQSHPWSQASRLSDYVHQNVDPANTGSVQRLQESSAHGALCRPIHTASCIPLTEAIASPTDIDLLNRRRIRIGSPLTEATLFPHSLQAAQQQRHFARHAEEYSDDDYGYENNKGSPSYVNVDEWKWKLNVLVRNPREQEIVSNEKKDRRDFEYLAPLARRLGLHSQMYGKYVVFSKVPLPNYRPDLDDKRPVRKVSIPLAVHKVVDSLLQEHLDRKQIYRRQNMKDGISNQAAVGQIADSINIDNKQPENQSEQSDPLMKSPIAEDILYRRSMRLRSKQQAWQESREGQKMNAFRKTLPAYKEREALLSAVAKNQVLVISGETGCGKTTQLPQYILESEIEAGRGGSCSIICTQPRRISAMSVAERVAAERGEELGDSIGYKVRLEGVKGRATRLLFCTTGILLRRLLVDPSLKGVTHVIVDEIHERGMNEDFLLIVLKDLLPSRPDLKLVLMSATLNAELFSSFFGGAPMHHIPGFTYPVKEYFLEDILELTGHRLSEYNQIDDYGQDKMWKMQKQMQNKRRKNALNCLVEDALVDADFRAYSGMTQYSVSQWSAEGLGFNLIQAVLCHICKHEREGAVLVFMTGWDDINALKDLLNSHPLLGNPSKVLLVPCHGAMASKDQKLIFEHPSPHVRKIVLATNMAETSITINDVVFVVDCGKAKETSYDALNNTPCLTPTWISKASARQRRGRAGRVQPGECYHLYPRAVYEAFAEYQQPELLRVPLHSLCLQIKSLKLGSIGGFLSKALQPPEALSVQNSVELLKTLGALDHKEELTHLGHHLSMLPVEPTVGKLLIMGAVFRCVEPVLTIAAGLTLRDPFLLPMDKKLMAEKARYKFGADDCSDHIALVRAYEGWLTAMREGNAIDYCWKNFLSFQTLQAMQSLRNQFRGLLKEAKFLDADNQDCNEYSSDRDLLGGVICAGLFPGIASVLSNNRNTHFKTVEDGQVLLNQNCVLSRMDKIPYPWLAFNEKVKTGTVIIRDSTGVSDTVLLLFGGKVETGGKEGHLVMQDGWLEFFMLPELAETILVLKEELDFLLCRKLEDPKLDIYEEGRYLINAVFELLHGDQNEGVFTEVKDLHKRVEGTSSLQDVKGLLQNRLQKDGFKPPKYKVKERRDDLFEAYVELKGQQFIGKPATSKKQAEKNAAADALEWLDSAPSSDKQEGRPKFKQNVSNNRRSSTPAVSENGSVLNVHGTVASRSRASTKDRGTALSKIKETLLSEDSLHKKRALSQQSKLEEAESTKAIKAQIRKIIKGHTDGSFMCN